MSGEGSNRNRPWYIRCWRGWNAYIKRTIRDQRKYPHE